MADKHQFEAWQLKQDTIIELYELDLSPIGVNNQYNFTSDKYTSGTPINFKGKVYDCLPIIASGFESSQKAPFPRPQLQVSNVFGTISSLILLFEDLVGAKVTRRRVFAKFLGDPNAPEAPLEIYFIERKVSESEIAVEYELVSGIQLNNATLPGRKVTRRCPWLYRGTDCGYTDNRYFDLNNNPTLDPSLDSCNKTIQACKLRFGEHNQLNFGGFPSLT